MALFLEISGRRQPCEDSSLHYVPAVRRPEPSPVRSAYRHFLRAGSARSRARAWYIASKPCLSTTGLHGASVRTICFASTRQKKQNVKGCLSFQYDEELTGIPPTWAKSPRTDDREKSLACLLTNPSQTDAYKVRYRKGPAGRIAECPGAVPEGYPFTLRDKAERFCCPFTTVNTTGPPLRRPVRLE